MHWICTWAQKIKIFRVVSWARGLGIGKWETNDILNSREKFGIGKSRESKDWELPKKLSGTIRKAWEVNLFREF
jgi:hypothetical protein